MNSIEAKQFTQLDQGLNKLCITVPNESKTKLIQFLTLLTKWNTIHNLTRITQPEKMVSYHLFDSLAINKFLRGDRIIDVGTGAGLPGIPLAIINPDKKFVLLDSLKKRIVFLQQVNYELKLNNVEIIHSRVEDFHPEMKFDQIITRAYAALPEMLKTTSALAGKNTQFLAMKGANFQQELELIPDSYKILDIHILKVPNLDAKRHLIVLERMPLKGASFF